MLKNFSPELRRTLARGNLAYFARYLGYENTADFQDGWYEFLTPKNDPDHFSPIREHTKAQKKFCELGPSKHSKSECISINYLSWLIGKYPEIHILVVSKTDTLSGRTVAAIKRRIEYDERYKAVFGNLKPENPQMWTDTAFIVKRREISKFPTISACGLYGSGALTGGGFDLVIGDDIIDKENVATELQRVKASEWFFDVLMPTLFPWGAIYVVGSRWHHDDLYNELITPEPEGRGWNHQVLKAILNEAEILKGAAPKVLWPQVWSYERLLQKRRDLGTLTFECEYQNQPTALQGDVLKADWLHAWNEVDPNFYPNPNLPTYAGIDPSLGESDYFGIASFSYDQQKQEGYLLDVWCEHLPFPQIVRDKLPESVSRLRYQKMYMETNFWQKLLLKYPSFQRHPATGAAYPIVPVQTVTNKEQRFIPLSSHFESRRVLVNPLLLSQRGEFLKQWVEFPRGQHDDAIDCVDLVVSNVLNEGGKPFLYVVKR